MQALAVVGLQINLAHLLVMPEMIQIRQSIYSRFRLCWVESQIFSGFLEVLERGLSLRKAGGNQWRKSAKKGRFWQKEGHILPRTAKKGNKTLLIGN